MIKSTKIILSLFVVIFLTACNISLAGDVTPPPGYQPAPQSQPQAQSTDETPREPVYPLVAPNPSDGEVTFAKSCAPCHGATGLGDGPQAGDLPIPPTAFASSEAARQAVLFEWFDLVTYGDLDRYMPPFKNLTVGQRWDALAYAMQLSAPKVVLETGKTLYSENCAACHGKSGQGDGVSAASLSVKPSDFTNQAFMAQKTNQYFYDTIQSGVEPVMPSYSDIFSEDESWSIVAYVRSLSFQTGESQASTEPSEGAQATEDVESPPATEMVEAAPITNTISLGSITGSVINTSDSTWSESLEVTLHAFDQMNVVFTQTTTTSADGTYAFKDLEMPNGRIFLTTVDFGGITYGSDVATVGSEAEDFDLIIEIYETSTDVTSLSIDRLHYFFEFLGPEIVRVVELYIISNPTPQTIVAKEGDPAILSFTLPDGATNLEIQDGKIGERYIETEDGFADTAPVRPGMGNYQVLFSYEMPYSKKLELDRKMELPVKAVVILVPESGLEIKGDTIQDMGTRDVQGMMYKMYNGSALNAGEELKMTITGKMVGETPDNSSNLLVGLGALGVVLVAAGLWLYRRNQESMEDSEVQDHDLEGEQPFESAESIMDAILTLDDLYQAEELPEEAYLQRRSELKDRLQKVINADQSSQAM